MNNTDRINEFNNRLSENNLDLDSIIDTINNLPNAGEDIEIKLQTKSVTPTTSLQSITADSGYTGLGKVAVAAVTSAIDSDIKAENIKKGIDILGVTGILEEGTNPILQQKTVSPATTAISVKPDGGYDGLSEVIVNAMAAATQATPSISVSSSGLITASSTQEAGYVAAGTKSSTKQLTTKAAATITPTTSNQTAVASGVYTTGAITVKGDANLISSNIRSGKSIFGVSGTLVEGITPSGTINITTNGTHNVTNYASANVNVPSEDISSEINTYETYLSTQEVTIENIASALVGKIAGGGGNTDIEDGLITRTLTSYTNDRITTVGSQAFRGFSKLTSISLPNVTILYAYALDSCSGLTDVNLPNVTTLQNYAMQNCKALTRLEFTKKITTQGAVWLNCSALTTLILRGDVMSGLGNKNCFNGTPIASGTGYIYVPDNLVDSYKAATNWSTYAAQIKGLSELGG
jgi:hypothetical protein